MTRFLSTCVLEWTCMCTGGLRAGQVRRQLPLGQLREAIRSTKYLLDLSLSGPPNPGRGPWELGERLRNNKRERQLSSPQS